MSQISGKRQPFGMTPIDSDLLAVNRNNFTNHAPVAGEMILPNVITDQGDRRRIQVVFFRAKLAPRIGCTPRNENASAEICPPR